MSNNTAAEKCQFIIEYDEFTLAYDVEWGENGLGEVPDTGDQITNVHVQIGESDWCAFDADLDDKMHAEMILNAKESYE